MSQNISESAFDAARNIAPRVPSDYAGMHRLSSDALKKIAAPIQSAIDTEVDKAVAEWGEVLSGYLKALDEIAEERLSLRREID